MIYFNNEAKLHPDKEFFIFQHPIFPHKIDFDLSSNLKVLQFDYDKFNLAQYYDALSQLDLLVAGGSSILLDAAFLKIQIAFIAFEIVPQNFWVSALRYKDFVYHFHKFIEITGVKVIRSRKEFVDVVNEVHLGQCIVDSDLSNYFTGDIQKTIAMKSLLSKKKKTAYWVFGLVAIYGIKISNKIVLNLNNLAGRVR